MSPKRLGAGKSPLVWRPLFLLFQHKKSSVR
nr:MAG TPA: hypothetical protein [Caudoviricetes sp.]